MRKGEVTSNFSFSHNVFYPYGTYFSFEMHFKMSSAICFNLDQSKILSSGNGLIWTRLKFLSHGKGLVCIHTIISFNSSNLKTVVRYEPCLVNNEASHICTKYRHMSAYGVHTDWSGQRVYAICYGSIFQMWKYQSSMLFDRTNYLIAYFVITCLSYCLKLMH